MTPKLNFLGLTRIKQVDKAGEGMHPRQNAFKKAAKP